MVPGFAGVEKEPNPWDATLPVPAVKVPLDFCSPKEDCPKLKFLAPLFPNRLLVPTNIVRLGFVMRSFQITVSTTQITNTADYLSLPEDCPNPPVAAAAPNGFLFAASSLGLPPRPLKNPPPAGEPPALAEFVPNRLPPDDGCCRKH